MRHAITTGVAVVFLGLLLLASYPVSSAARPVLTVSVTVSATADLSCVTVSDQVTKCDFVSYQEWAGDWNGRVVLTGHWVVHDGKHFTAQGTGVFEGTILGRSGTATLHGVTIFWMNGLKEIEGGAVGDGTGELAGIHGHAQSPEDFYPTGGIYYWVNFS